MNLRSMVTSFVRIFGFIFFAWNLASCNQNVEGTSANVSTAKEVVALDPESDKYLIDSTSYITWIGSKPTGQHYGTIGIYEGILALDDQEVNGGFININLNRIDAIDLKNDMKDHDRLINHLKSRDFFDIDNFPDAKFIITSVDQYTESGSTDSQETYTTEYKPISPQEHTVQNPSHLVTGNLTMRGKTLSISFPAKIQFSDREIIADAKFNIDRTDWGLMYKNEGTIVDKARDSFIFNTVNVGFHLRASYVEALP